MALSHQNGTNVVTSLNDFTVKAGLAQMLKGGVIMDVVNAEQVRGSLDNPGINEVHSINLSFSLTLVHR